MIDRAIAFVLGWIIGDFSAMVIIAFFKGAFRNDEK